MSAQFLGAPSPISQAYLHPLAHTLPPTHYNHDLANYMNHGPPLPIFHTQADRHHGTKRSAPDDELESSANISTHFKKLRLNNARLPQSTTISPTRSSYYPNNYESTREPLQSQSHYNGLNDINNAMSDSPQLAAAIHPPSMPASDYMPLDDTPDKIYIHDLSAEIASIEAAEQSIPSTFLLPDFDKNVSKIPHNVLRQNFDTMANNASADNSQALVLYRDPTSISVPPEEDVVRKAIIEARKRIRNEYETANKSRRDDGDDMRDGRDSDSSSSKSTFGSEAPQGFTINNMSSEDIALEDDEMEDVDPMEIE